MARTGCPCCGDSRAAVALLRRRPMCWHGGWQPDASRAVARQPLCGLCCIWLNGILQEVSRDGRGPGVAAPARVFGAPATNSRALLFDDQCQVCHAVPSAGGALVDCVSAENQAQSWPPLFLCTACDAWLGSLADDGRSARGAADREIDGPYGEWPHPNLRELVVQVEVRDRGAGATVIESCAAMGVQVDLRRRGTGEHSVLFLEAVAGRDLARRVAEERSHRAAVVVLAGPSAAEPLRSALQAGASGWATIPLTPQQVTAALTAALRRHLRLNWDTSTALPIAANLDGARPALLFVPRPGVEPFAVSWLLRRFSRGYDEAAVSEGRMLLFPRVPAAQIGRVRVRLARVLAGQCSVSVVEGSSAASAVRRHRLSGTLAQCPSTGSCAGI